MGIWVLQGVNTQKEEIKNVKRIQRIIKNQGEKQKCEKGRERNIEEKTKEGTEI